MGYLRPYLKNKPTRKPNKQKKMLRDGTFLDRKPMEFFRVEGGKGDYRQEAKDLGFYLR